MKLLLIEAPKASVLWLAEEDGNVGFPARRAKYRRHKKRLSVSKSSFNNKVNPRRQSTLILLLRAWQGLVIPSPANWEVVRDALALEADTEALFTSFGYDLEKLLRGRGRNE